MQTDLQSLRELADEEIAHYEDQTLSGLFLCSLAQAAELFLVDAQLA